MDRKRNSETLEHLQEKVIKALGPPTITLRLNRKTGKLEPY